MRKCRLLVAIFVIATPLLISSCSWFKGPLEQRTGFFHALQRTENLVRRDEWKSAWVSYRFTYKQWRKIKPFLQIDIDHDYVNAVQERFALLKGYILTREKSEALASIFIIEETWENIGAF